MLIDLLSMDNYISFNIKIAQILGLHSAIYLSELMNINEKALRKAAMADNFFTIDRKYIADRTTISKDEQLKIDKSLSELGLLKVDENCNNTLTLNLAVLTNILNSEEVDLDAVKKLNEKLSKPKKSTKKEQEKEIMKNYIKTTNTELYDAYCDWIDSVYAKLGWMSKRAVEVGQKLVDETSDHNLDVALKIVEIAAINGWKDMQWAIKNYKDTYELNYRVKHSRNATPVTSQDLSEEVF